MTKIVSPEELESLLNKGQNNQQQKEDSKKPYTRKPSSSKKPEAKNKPVFTDSIKHLGKLEALTKKQLNRILRDHNSQWEIGYQLGEGGFSTVFTLKDRDGGEEEAALKLIDPYMAYRSQYKGYNNGLTLGELKNDRNLQSICRHIDVEFDINQLILKKEMKHCVRFYPDDSFIDDSIREHTAFIIMELMDGSLLSRPATLPSNIENWRIAYDMLSAILEDLQFLSEHNVEDNIFVRDLKPANILYRIEDRVVRYYLSDFGMGVIGEYSTNTKFSSPGYTAPESDKDIRSDLFSLARAAFFMCNGFTLGSSEHDKGKKYQSDQEKEKEYWDNTPEQFRDIIQKATDPNPENRFQTASEMLKEIHACSFETRQIIIDQANDEMIKEIDRLKKKHQEEVSKLEERIKELEGKTGEDMSSSTANEQILKLNKVITEKEDKIRELNQSLTEEKEKAIRLEGAASHGDDRVAELVEEAVNYKKQIEDKDAEISRLTIKEKQLEKLQPKLLELQEKVSELETENESMEKQISSLTSDASSAETLRKRNASLNSKLREVQTKALTADTKNKELENKVQSLQTRINGATSMDKVLMAHPSALLINHWWDIFKTIVFIAVFIGLYYEKMYAQMPLAFEIYAGVIFASMITGNIPLRKQLSEFGWFVFCTIVFFPEYLFVISTFENRFGNADLFTISLPWLDDLPFGHIGFWLLLGIFVLYDSILNYAKNLKHRSVDAEDPCVMVSLLGAAFAIVAIIIVVVRIFVPGFLIEGANVRYPAELLNMEGVSYDAEKERFIFDNVTINECLTFEGDTAFEIHGNVIFQNELTEAPLVTVKHGTLKIYPEANSSLVMNNAMGQDIVADEYIFCANSSNLNGSFTCNSEKACMYSGILSNITVHSASIHNQNTSGSSTSNSWIRDSEWNQGTFSVDGVEHPIAELGSYGTGYYLDEESGLVILNNAAVSQPIVFTGNVRLSVIGENTLTNTTESDQPMIEVKGGSLALEYTEGSSLQVVNDHGQDLYVEGNIYVSDNHFESRDRHSFTCNAASSDITRNACIYATKGVQMNLMDTRIVNNSEGGNGITYGHER
ncbi:MAG: hypothetical protein IKD69_08495 [Solobacterium sp.]|nr:hypothetical protein [Solobacterium sp.]